MSKITLHHLVEEAVGKFGGRSALDLAGIEDRPSPPITGRLGKMLQHMGAIEANPGYADQSIGILYGNDVNTQLSFRRHHDNSLSRPYVAGALVQILPHIHGIDGRNEGTVLGPVPNPFQDNLKGVLYKLCNDRDIAVVRTSKDDSGDYILSKQLECDEIGILLDELKNFAELVKRFRRFAEAKQVDARLMYNLGVSGLISQFDIPR